MGWLRFQKVHTMRIIPLLLVVIIGMASVPQEVSAHPLLTEVEPTPESVLASLPSRVTLTFSEPVEPIGNGVLVIAPDGRVIRLGASTSTTINRSTLTVELPSQLPEGTYLVTYSVLSRDGHFVNGRFTFSVGYPTTVPRAPVVLSASPFLFFSAGWIELFGLATLLGALLLRVLTSRGLTAILLDFQTNQLLTLARRGILLSLLAKGFLFAGIVLSTPNLDPAVLRPLLFSPGSLLSLLGMLSALLCYFVLAAWRQGKFGDALWTWTVGTLALSRAASSHAVSAPYLVLSLLFSFAHTVSTLTLIGGFLGLLILLRGQTSEPEHHAMRSLLRRFIYSGFILGEIAVISGAYQLWINVPNPSALLSTAYGRSLLVKLLVILIAGVIASAIVWRTLQAGTLFLPKIRYFFTITGVTGPLIAASFLITFPPPRDLSALTAPNQPPLVLAGYTGSYLVTLRVEPAKPGWNLLSVKLTSSGGKPVSGAEVTLELATREGPRLLPLTPRGDHYTTQLLLNAGLWDIAIYARPGTATVPPPARFRIPVPVPDGRIILEQTDAAMNRLVTARERTTLTSGGPTVETEILYQAPDRAAYTVRAPNRPETRTVILGQQRFDQTQGQPWESSPWPGTEPFRWPNFRYAQTAQDIRVLGIEPIDGVPCYRLSFFDPTSSTYYQFWTGVSDYLIRRYEMMALGHFMVSFFDRFDDPTIAISKPPTERVSALH